MKIYTITRISWMQKPKHKLLASSCWNRAPAPAQVQTRKTNLRSSALICGSFFANAPETKISIQKHIRMTRIGQIFTDYPIYVNPRHPRYPCSIVALLFAKALEICNAIYLQFAQTINLRSSAVHIVRMRRTGINKNT
jgi:hypothetical protein